MMKRAIVLAALLVLLVVALAPTRAFDTAPALLPPVLTIIPELQRVDTGTSLYAYDARRQLIYAGASGGIQPIALNGQKGQGFGQEWQPIQMSISPDGQTLFLLDWRKPSIALIDLDTRATVDEWLLPTPAGRGAPYMAQTMIALPGEPAVLIARYGIGSAPLYGIGVIDAAGLRPATVAAVNPPHFQLADDPGTVFVQFDSTFLVLHVDETGVSLTDSHSNLVGWKTFTYEDGLLFGRDGTLASAETFQRLGRFNTYGSVVPDVARGYAYYLQAIPNEAVYLQVFDIATFRKVAEAAVDVPYEALTHADGLIRTGDDSYAILGGDALYLLRFRILDHAVAVPLAAKEYCSDFFEDFSVDSPYTWPTRDDAAGLVTIDNGELLVVARTLDAIGVAIPACFRPNYELTADVHAANNGHAFYGLLYTYDGGVPGGVGGSVHPWLQVWSPSFGGSGDPSDAIHPDQAVNRLRIRVHYDDTVNSDAAYVDFYINDVPLRLDRRVAPLRRGQSVGLIVRPYWDANSAVRFDNIRYRAIPPWR